MIGDVMRRLRTDRGLNQKELAEMLGVTQANISSWEVGRTQPNMGMVQKLAEALGVTVSTLLEIEEPKRVDFQVDNAEKVLIEMVRKMDNDSANRLFVYALDLLKLGGD